MTVVDWYKKAQETPSRGVESSWSAYPLWIGFLVHVYQEDVGSRYTWRLTYDQALTYGLNWLEKYYDEQS